MAVSGRSLPGANPASGGGPLPGGDQGNWGLPGGSAAGRLRSFAAGVRLGWAIEANWTDPFLFLVYSIARPVGSALILVAMVWLVAGGGRADSLSYMVTGSALWTFVGGGLLGFVFAILDDRERYRMLKYVVVSPVRFLPFLVGRSIAQIITAAAGFVVTFTVGVVFLGVHPSLSVHRLPLLVVSVGLGLVTLIAMGIAVAGLCLTIRREAWSYPEAIAGALYLVSGVVFPPDVLPEPLRIVALALPTAWWLEGARRGLLDRSTDGLLASVSDSGVVLALLGTTILLTLVGAMAFRWFERRARERGLLDQTTGS